MKNHAIFERKEIVSAILNTISLNIYEQRGEARRTDPLGNRINGLFAEHDFEKFVCESFPDATLYPGCIIICPRGSNRRVCVDVVGDLSEVQARKWIYDLLLASTVDQVLVTTVSLGEGFVKVGELSDLESNAGSIIRSLDIRYYSYRSGEFLPHQEIGDALPDFEEKTHQSQLLTPSEAGKNAAIRLHELCPERLISILRNRIVLDGVLSRLRKDAVDDIDYFVITPNKPEGALIEIKEKDLSRCAPRGFGIDSRRIESLLEKRKATGLPVCYVVRQIDNQEDRQILSWRAIGLSKFYENCGATIMGGEGMALGGMPQETRICPNEYFIDLSSRARGK